MVKKVALIFAVVFAVIGIAGFIPALSPTNVDGQKLLHLFQVNSAQNVIHLLTAAVALVAYLGGGYYAATYFKVFGVVYALVALWGLPGLTHTYNGVLFGLLHVNIATELLHVAIAAVALYVGFMPMESKTTVHKTSV